MAEVDFDEERRLAQDLFPVQPPMPSAPVTNNGQPRARGGFMDAVTNIAQNRIVRPLQESLGLRLSPQEQYYQNRNRASAIDRALQVQAINYFNDLTPQAAEQIGLNRAQLDLARANPIAAYDDVVSRAFSRETFSTTPTYGVDKLGNRVGYQLSDRGTAKVIDYTPSQEYDTQDTGGSILVFKKGTRILVETIPKTMTADQQARIVIDQRKATQEQIDKLGARRKTLRDSWNKAIKVPSAAFFAFEKVRESADLNSAYGDVALLTNFMKVLDPDSIVRESEFDMIANTGGLPVAIANAFRKSANGELLSPEQRNLLVTAAMANLKPYITEVESQQTFFNKEAERQGVDAANVFVNPFTRLPDDLYEQYGLERANEK